MLDYVSAINYYYDSLSSHIDEKINQLGLQSEEVYPERGNDNNDYYYDTLFERKKRVSQIRRNNKNKYHYLLTDDEVNLLTETLDYKTENNLLWGHINWEILLTTILTEIDKETHDTSSFDTNTIFHFFEKNKETMLFHFKRKFLDQFEYTHIKNFNREFVKFANSFFFAFL